MYSIHSSPSSHRLAGRDGFTLIELLVALMISGLLVGVVFQLLQGNGRFLQMQSAREEVQQNGRAALDLIAGELRALPPGGIVSMSPNSIQIHVPRAWGVLCNDVSTTTATAWVLFGGQSFPESEDLWGRQHWGLAVEQTTNPGVSTGVYRFVNNVTRQTTGDPCLAIQADLGPQHERYGFSAGGRSFVTAGTVPAGTQVLLYEEVRYDVSQGGTIPGYWIRRMAGYSGGVPNMQPMAGPVPGESALLFEYLRQDGVTPATVASDVRLIRLTVATESRSRSVGDATRAAQRDTVTAEIFLRN